MKTFILNGETINSNQSVLTYEQIVELAHLGKTAIQRLFIPMDLLKM
jgi:hypothetical protein